MSIKILFSVSLCLVVFLGSCKKDPFALNERCFLKPDPGFCNAAFPKFYYDVTTQSCKVFTWGGCGGLIPFETQTACEEACMGK